MTIEDNTDQPRFLTTEDVLGYLNVTSRTIYRLIRIGELPAVRIGRQWRIRRADLERWLSQQQSTVPYKGVPPSQAPRRVSGA